MSEECAARAQPILPQTRELRQPECEPGIVAEKSEVAGEARVRIWREDGLACISVEDGGVGFDPAAAGGGFGLLALRERVAGLGGRVEIDSAAGRGTRVVVSVPAAPGGDGDAP